MLAEDLSVTLWLMVQLPHSPLWWTSHRNSVNLTEEFRVPFLKSEWICALMSHDLCHMRIPSVYAHSQCITQLHQTLMHFVDITQRTQTSDKVDQVSNPHATIRTAHHSKNPEYLRPVMYAHGRHMKERNWRHSTASTISSLSHSHGRMHVHTNTHSTSSIPPHWVNKQQNDWNASF